MIDKLKYLDYEKYIETTFLRRYINPIELHDFLVINYGNYISNIGSSTFGLPIFKVSLGSGKNKVIGWTQMHGNESTGTLGVLDILKFYNDNQEFKEFIEDNFTLEIIIMLNPDGAKDWKRTNAFGIDVNRDYLKSSSIEMKLLLQEVLMKNFDLALNIHDQRTIFGIKGSGTPATLSLLAPSINAEEEMNYARKKSIKLISYSYRMLSSTFPNQIARFDDTFYPNSTGDNFQKLGIPTVLMESGFYPKDYERKHARKLFFYSFITLISSMLLDELHDDYTYYTIPENASIFNDMILKNVKIFNKETVSLVDIIIQFKETLENNSLHYEPIIESIGTSEGKKAWQEFDLKGAQLDYEPNLIDIQSSAQKILDILEIDYHNPNSET